MRNYMLIGQIMGAKTVTRKDKTSGQTLANTEVIVQFLDYDKNGELVLDTDTIQFSVDELDIFKANVSKFVAIPHLFMVAKSGTYLFPDDSMDYHFYDKNPLIQEVEEVKDVKDVKDVKKAS